MYVDTASRTNSKGSGKKKESSIGVLFIEITREGVYNIMLLFSKKGISQTVACTLLLDLLVACCLPIVDKQVLALEYHPWWSAANQTTVDQDGRQRRGIRIGTHSVKNHTTSTADVFPKCTILSPFDTVHCVNIVRAFGLGGTCVSGRNCFRRMIIGWPIAGPPSTIEQCLINSRNNLTVVYDLKGIPIV